MDADKDKSGRILDELKRRRDRGNAVDVEEERIKLVIFSLLNGYYAFHGNYVKEILPVGSIFYVPGAPDFILGVVNIRGDIESVIAINKFLGLPGQGVMQSSRIAIASTDEMRSGILVDSIEDVIDVPVSALKPPIATLDQSRKEFVAGEFTCDGKNITLLDIGRIFGKIV